MTQPGQSVLLELTDPFVRETESSAQLTQGAWRNAIQAVAGDDDLSQSVGELGHERQQSVVDQRTIEVLVQTSLCDSARRMWRRMATQAYVEKAVPRSGS